MAKTEEIIRRSGVSRSTVFRFFRGDNVRPEAKKAIIKAMEELGCKTEDLICKDITFEISVAKDFESFKGFTEVIRGITEQAEEKNVKIQLAVRTGEQIRRDYEKWNENSTAKGIIIVGKDLENELKELQLLREKGIPHIFVNRIIDEPDASYIAVDVRKAACELVEYLLDNGHQSIATLGYPEMLRIDRDKLQGYYEAFSRRGIPINEQYLHLLKEGESSDEAIDKILQMAERPTAFFGICDSYAMKLINKARALGLEVPQDIAVVGMDDLEIAQYYRPALTTIRSPFKKMGIMAVDYLLHLVAGDLASIKTIVKHELFIREST